MSPPSQERTTGPQRGRLISLSLLSESFESQALRGAAGDRETADMDDGGDLLALTGKFQYAEATVLDCLPDMTGTFLALQKCVYRCDPSKGIDAAQASPPLALARTAQHSQQRLR